ncbi:hypothetical protein BASA50_001866 [Batrachochytrium salamandrivorans]|uniref:peptidylprolyl isomerase n=1 Tax=Batrachochytrium salamandrivorans TaxID=1357716 RepID=A0ABQ8FQX4_9FUNG|nr:hypothetical protein BASA60_006391 [Batrachochytrium salamandrivorans]KAH6577857.1 hypothetical protein BASA62_000647 [Batrachochytrium salamandrivorans]KAH6590330.1 hypothetical protein BASA61_005326 [Batrachochytrium salamandrivorans]KAH6601038.1 hypothetical protein BASA50_001866 [Batrachochytrium salamandrivorans]KAH9251764.1 hypothetical protein BASA81_010330 [Batrachochytrium salamandrivorans]
MADITRNNFATGKTHRDTGNQFFKDGLVKEALKEYNTALLFLNGLDNSAMAAFVAQGSISPLTPEEKGEITNTVKACHANMAACYLKQENYKKAIDFCDKVLKVDTDNAKAMYRKGLALFKMNDLEPALASLMAAARLSPNDTMIREQIALVKARVTELETKSRNELRNNLKM